MEDSSDGGAISFWGTGINNRIINNLIFETGSSHLEGLNKFSIGIYLDDSSDRTTVKDNILHSPCLLYTSDAADE